MVEYSGSGGSIAMTRTILQDVAAVWAELMNESHHERKSYGLDEQE